MADMDTAAKRLSALDWDGPFHPGIPIPDGISSAGDRQHGMWNYGFVIAAAESFSGEVLPVSGRATITRAGGRRSAISSTDEQRRTIRRVGDR